MIYETAAALDNDAVLAALKTFLTTNGWTVLDNQASYFVAHNGVGRFRFSSKVQSGVYGLECKGEGTVATQTLAPHVAVAQCSLIGGQEGSCLNYHFSLGTTPNTLVIAIEYEPSRFSLIICGDLTLSGYPFVTGTMYDYSTSRADENSYYPFYAEGDANGVLVDGVWMHRHTDDIVSSIGRDLTSPFFSVPNFHQQIQGAMQKSGGVFNGIVGFMPVYQYTEDTVAGLWRFCGEVANVFMVNMLNLDPGQIIEIGADDYMVFPCCVRPEPFAYSANNRGLGVAVKIT